MNTKVLVVLLSLAVISFADWPTTGSSTDRIVCYIKGVEACTGGSAFVTIDKNRSISWLASASPIALSADTYYRYILYIGNVNDNTYGAGVRSTVATLLAAKASDDLVLLHITAAVPNVSNGYNVMDWWEVKQ